jgi:alpha-galactosidase
VFRDSTQAIWMANDSIPGTIYVGLFNLEARPRTVEFLFGRTPGLTGRVNVHDIWKEEDLGTAEGVVRADLPPHGSAFYILTRNR